MKRPPGGDLYFEPSDQGPFEYPPRVTGQTIRIYVDVWLPLLLAAGAYLRHRLRQ